MALAVGSVVEGVVTGITKFGAFVQLPTGETGLVHISEVANTYVKDVKDYLKEQDRVKVKIIHIDERGRIGLSIKQADPAYEARPRRQRPSYNASFEEKLARFLKESEDRLQDLKRSVDAKRGGRGAR
ncbi:MAG: S1 RNA-binding domain-containing protein [Clostridia bacterium]|jgi:S1 RNA binding domain protein|nr:S1 RNA-binding domain-containing protein [Clostridia bacterium]MDH7572714.1 S1 RNA-binding domain-containing protein [Clostridia bacterium]